jgi:hypothetical protein
MRSVKQNIATPDIAELRDELRRVAEMLELLVCAAREGEAASFTLKKFRARNQLSQSQYHKLRRQGRDPRRMRVGSCGVRISRQAELDWILARETEAEAAMESDIVAAHAMRPAPRTPMPPAARRSMVKPLTPTPRGAK